MRVTSTPPMPLLLDYSDPATYRTTIMADNGPEIDPLELYDPANDPLCSAYNTKVEFDDPFDIRDWIRLGSLEDPQALPNNLTGPIHKIMDLPNWKNLLPQDAQEAMKPALRLATALLLSQPSLAFIDALLFEFRKPVGRRGDRDLYVLPGPSPYSKNLRVEIEGFFNDLHEYVDFRFHGYDSHHWAVNSGDLGYTAQDQEKEAEIFRGSGCDFGCASKITIAENFGDTLAELYRSPQTPQTISQQLRVQFYLAVTICHELVHAIDNALQENLVKLEPYFGDHGLNELGWAWEDFVFGGGISAVQEAGEIDHVYRPVAEWPLFLSRFPSPVHYFTLLAEDNPSPTRMVFAGPPKPPTRTTTSPCAGSAGCSSKPPGSSGNGPRTRNGCACPARWASSGATRSTCPSIPIGTRLARARTSGPAPAAPNAASTRSRATGSSSRNRSCSRAPSWRRLPRRSRSRKLGGWRADGGTRRGRRRRRRWERKGMVRMRGERERERGRESSAGLETPAS